MKLPHFNADGLLPAGDYPLTLTQLRESHLVNSSIADWDAQWRLQLVQHLEVLVAQLWKVGVDEIFVDGSFVEDKAHPSDIDGYFVCDRGQLISGELQRNLNALDPFKVWTWDPRERRAFKGHAKKQLPMWHTYRVELYPHVGQLAGIRDKFGNELEFPSAFRLSRRDGAPRGIVKIIRG